MATDNTADADFNDTNSNISVRTMTDIVISYRLEALLENLDVVDNNVRQVDDDVRQVLHHTRMNSEKLMRLNVNNEGLLKNNNTIIEHNNTMLDQNTVMLQKNDITVQQQTTIAEQNTAIVKINKSILYQNDGIRQQFEELTKSNRQIHKWAMSASRMLDEMAETVALIYSIVEAEKEYDQEPAHNNPEVIPAAKEEASGSSAGSAGLIIGMQELELEPDVVTPTQGEPSAAQTVALNWRQASTANASDTTADGTGPNAN